MRVGRRDEHRQLEVCLETARGVWVVAEVSLSDCPWAAVRIRQAQRAKTPTSAVLWHYVWFLYYFTRCIFKDASAVVSLSLRLGMLTKNHGSIFCHSDFNGLKMLNQQIQTGRDVTFGVLNK